MAESERFQAVPMQVFNTATLTGSFQILNGTGYPDIVRVYKLYNASNTDIILSYDGTTEHDIAPAKSTLIVDLQINHDCDSSYGSGTYRIPIGQLVYGKGGAGVGNLYIIGYV